MVRVNGLPRWKAIGQHSPLTTASEHVEQGVEYGFPFPFSSVWVARFGQEGFDEVTFGFVKIGWVGFHRCRRSLPAISMILVILNVFRNAV